MDELKIGGYLLPYNLQFFAEGGDKTEQPTTKKLTDARKKGQVVKSKELTTASGLATLFFLLKIFTTYLRNKFLEVFNQNFLNISKFTNDDLSGPLVQSIVNDQIIQVIKICIPFFVTGVFVTVVVLLVQVKWKITAEPLLPKFSKLNPISGFKKIFSKDKLVETLVDIIKIVIITVIVYNKLKEQWGLLSILYDLPLLQAIILIGSTVIDLGITISVVFIIVGVADLFYQKFKFMKDLRMTKQEVKDEFKQSEGDPAVKSKIKAKMREVSQRRMMQAVPQADVVITNPTHFAAAIKYDKETSDAPILVAKGADYVAAKIKEIAKENNVIIVENKPLARMLYYNVEVDDQIPPELYQMTAEVLAYIYGLKNKV